jgi:hypothetical protein
LVKRHDHYAFAASAVDHNDFTLVDHLVYVGLEFSAKVGEGG